MRENIFDDGDVSVFKDGARYFVRYDAGSHQIEMREDEISADEASKIIASPEEINGVLFAIQRKLQAAGLNPYKSNI